MLLRFSLLLFPVALAAGMADRAGAAGTDTSPFLPVSSPTAAASRAPDGSAYELRGIMSAGNGTRYCIYDPVKKSSTWVGPNETGNPFVVKAADPTRDTVTLEAGGQVMTLALHEAKVVSLSPNSVGAMAPPPMPIGRVVLKPTPEDEQRRLQAIAEEVRRRRELRERSQQPGSGQR